MTVLDDRRPTPTIYQPCGATRPGWGMRTSELPCVLRMGHEIVAAGEDDGIHVDRMGGSWEMPISFIPRRRYADVTNRITAELQATLEVLDRIALDVGCMAPTMLREVAQNERHRVHALLDSMGLALTEETN